MSKDSLIDLTEAFQSMKLSLPTSTSRALKDYTSKLRNPPIEHPDREIETARIYDESTIKVGDNVELLNQREASAQTLSSGDFFRIHNIIHNVETNETRLRGWRFIRARYYEPIFDYKINELVLVLNVIDDDARSPWIQGQEEISISEVLRKRDIVLSHRPYETLLEDRKMKNHTFHTQPFPRRFNQLTRIEQQSEIFHNARLVCRETHILKHDIEGKFYQGEVRLLYRTEGDFRSRPFDGEELGSSRKSSILVDVEEQTEQGQSRTPSMVFKMPPIDFGDFFCCAGGATQGATQAGLNPKFAADKDNLALAVYALNHPGAKIYLMDAHDIQYIDEATERCMKVEILHLSPPCRYWSPLHTRSGKEDQANYESIKTVGPILKKLGPTCFTMEQTYGLVRTKEFKRHFYLLLNDIHNAGYNCRYKVEDASKFGVPQKRMRLLIIGAKRGFPIPAFPEPRCGPPGSGLKPFVYVADALRPLERQRPRAPYDMYDDTSRKRTKDKPSYNPRTEFLKGCVTRSGGANYHYSGKRKFTAREIFCVQTFTLNYKLKFSPTRAISFAGDAFPPVFAEAVLQRVAQTIEAFKHNLINESEDTTDLRGLLASRGVVFRRLPSNPDPQRNTSSSPLQVPEPHALYRYLPHLADNDPEPTYPLPRSVPVEQTNRRNPAIRSSYEPRLSGNQNQRKRLHEDTMTPDNFVDLTLE